LRREGIFGKGGPALGGALKALAPG